MRIGVVNPQSQFLQDEKVFPPLGILYICAVIKELGARVYFYDCIPIEDLEINESIVFITCTSPQVEYVLQVVNKFKDKQIIVGGCGVESIQEKDIDKFYAVVKGEGESIVYTLFQNLKHGNGKAGFVQSRNNIDINNIPYPERSLINGYDYRINGHKTTSIITSRGCPFGCLFCTHGKEKGVRIRSVENVKGEIDIIYDLGYKGLMFYDDIFTYNSKRLLNISTYIKNKSMVYRCFSHVKYIKKVANILQETNCYEVGLGIESGSNKILQTIKKGNTSQEGLAAVKILKDYGVKVKVFLMLGLPGEDKESILETISWLEKANPDDFDICIFSPYPGSELFGNKAQYDINWESGSYLPYKGKAGSYTTKISTSKLTINDLIYWRDLIERKFKGSRV